MAWIFTSHVLSTNAQGMIECSVCGRTWVKGPQDITHCPGLKMYRWGKWPEHLLTKKQLDDAGYSVGKTSLPKPAGACWREESPDGLMLLYDRNTATRKRELSETEKAARQAATEKMAQKWRCQRCGRRVERYGRTYCETCGHHVAMVDFSREVLSEAEIDKYVILDSESTGLSPGYNEIIELAITDLRGMVLLDTRIKPRHPERVFEVSERGRSAYDIHGIHPDQLVAAPTFAEVYPKIQALIKDKIVLIYNEDYDHPMLDGDCKGYGLEKLTAAGWDCVMLSYAQWVGEIRWERNRRGRWSDWSYRWQPLNGGHSAVEDCKATLAILHEMTELNKETANVE